MELKPCPFCGREATLLARPDGCFEVRCLNDGCFEGVALNTEILAIKAWNTRPHPSTPGISVSVEELTEVLKPFTAEHAHLIAQAVVEYLNTKGIR